MTLSSAMKLAASAVKKAQTKHKKYYDCNTRPLMHQVGEWVLIHFPVEETGQQRKLLKPWYGPYQVTTVTETEVTAIKVHSPQDGTISVHASIMTRCPLYFLLEAGQRSGPGRLLRWVDQDETEPDQKSREGVIQKLKEPTQRQGSLLLIRSGWIEKMIWKMDFLR